MGYVKIDTVKFNDLKTAIINNYNTLSSDVSTALSTFKDAADEYSATWTDQSYIDLNWGAFKKDVSTDDYYTTWTDEKNVEHKDFDNAAWESAVKKKTREWIVKKQGEYNTAKSAIDASLEQAVTDLDKIKTAVEKIDEFYKNFNATKLYLEKALEKFTTTNGGSFEWDEAGSTYTLAGEDGQPITVYVPVLKYKIGDNTYTIAEMVNCAYTYMGTISSGYGALASMAASGNMTEEEFETQMQKYVASTGATTDKYLQNGFYSVAHQEGLNTMYREATGQDYDSTKYNSVLAKYSIDEKEYEEQLVDGTNGTRLGAMAVAGAFMGAYSQIDGNGEVTYKTLTDEEKEELGFGTKKKEEEEKTTEEPSSDPTPTPSVDPDGGGGTPGGGGGTPGSGGGDTQVDNPETPEEETTEEVPEEEVHEEYEEQYEEIEEVIEEADEDLEDIKEDFEETDTEEIQEENKEVTEEFIDDQAKDDYFDKVNENDGDNSLREEIAEKTESFENRFIENQNNPTDAGTQEIKAELKELGYDDAAIDKIMSGDPTVAKNAFKVGVQDQEMAKIANELAEKAGIEDFDTSYDDSQSYDSLHDGTVNVELTDHDRFIDTLRPESGSNAETPKVVTEYDEYQQAETDFVEAKESYEEIYTETNKSIEAAEDAKADLDKYLTELKEKSGEDPTKWSEDEIKELNKLTTTYNTKVEEANENNEKYLKQYKEYKAARDTFNKEKGEYYDELLDFYQKELGIDKSNNNPTPSTPVVKEPDNSNYTDEAFIHMINNGNGIDFDAANELLNK